MKYSSPTQVEIDSARVHAGKFANNEAEKLYALLLRKLDSSKNDFKKEIASPTLVKMLEQTDE